MKNSRHNIPSDQPYQELETPSLLRRFAAMVYDTLLLMAISIFYGAIMIAINVAFNGAPTAGARVDWGNFGGVVFVGWLLTLGLFFCYFWRKSGQTLGMKTWRLKMYNASSFDLPSTAQCIIRCLCAPISLLALGAGYWVMYLKTDRQTFHDSVSKTRVVLLQKNKK